MVRGSKNITSESCPVFLVILVDFNSLKTARRKKSMSHKYLKKTEIFSASKESPPTVIFSRTYATIPYMTTKKTETKFDENTIYILDSYGLIYRSYFAFISKPLTNSRGENVSALFGFFRNLHAVIEHYKPRYLEQNSFANRTFSTY